VSRSVRLDYDALRRDFTGWLGRMKTEQDAPEQELADEFDRNDHQ
jgi:hypothetical protein